jgi:hypothetical protein
MKLATSYEITVVADDGTYASTEVITITVADVNEAPTLSCICCLQCFSRKYSNRNHHCHQFSDDPEAGAIYLQFIGERQ